MSIKKKLGMGVLTGALGLALIGGGTWAAFNDIAHLENTFAAGTLKLCVEDKGNVPQTFDLQNLKPGDSMTRMFDLTNCGTLAIKEVLLSAEHSNFLIGEGNDFYERDYTAGIAEHDGLDFLDQFLIEILRVDQTNGAPAPDPNFQIISAADNVTLRDLVEGNLPAGVITVGGRINLAPHNSTDMQYDGIPVTPPDTDYVEMKVSFIDDPTKVGNTNYNLQNRYQDNSIDLTFELEATQWNGIEVNENGYIEENERAYPQNQPQTTP